MSTKIFTITHKQFTPPKDTMYVPLHVGRARAEDLGYLGDHTGDSISHLNPYFCELTGMYWLWKNNHNVDIIGICHYRRYLINKSGNIFTEKELQELLNRYDILTTKLLTLPKPYYEGFSANHHSKDLVATGNVIKEKYPELSKGQKRLANYVTENYEKAVFLTAVKLGEVVGVSESTVVRFATQLGYKGYPGFQRALEELVRNRLNSIQRMEVTYGRISQSEIIQSVLQSDIEKIKLTMSAIDTKAFNMAIDIILNARKIYIVGIRSCEPLASFLSFYLHLIFEDVVTVSTNGSSEMFEQLIRIGEEDVIIGISFPRYSVRTLKAMEFASNRKAKVITLTDSIHSPMNLYSSCNLIARSDMASIVDSLVAPLSVINALVVALCLKKQGEVISTLETLEQIWGEYQVYSNDELNPIREIDDINE